MDRVISVKLNVPHPTKNKQLSIITLKGEEQTVICDSFEFRSNQVTNWIKFYLKSVGVTDIIHDVAVIKSISF